MYGRGFDDVKVKMKADHSDISRRIEQDTCADFKGTSLDIAPDADKSSAQNVVDGPKPRTGGTPIGRI